MDLRPHVYETGTGWTVLKHPLVFMVPYHPTMAALANKIYAGKVELLREATDKGDWHQVVFLHERPHRWQALAQVSRKLRDQEYWPLVGSVWTDTENMGEQHKVARRLLLAREPTHRYLMMREEDRAAFALLPDPVLAWRGCRTVDDHWMSWTLDAERARWFATRFKQPGFLLHAELPREAVLAYFDARGEQEVVVATRRHVRLQAVLRVEHRPAKGER